MDADRKRELLVALFGGGRQGFVRVRDAVAKAVQHSFEEDHQRSVILLPSAEPSRAEIKRRADLCYDLLLAMKGDMHYSTHKACDLLSRGLRAKLDGQHWEPPPAERAWASHE